MNEMPVGLKQGVGSCVPEHQRFELAVESLVVCFLDFPSIPRSPGNLHKATQGAQAPGQKGFAVFSMLTQQPFCPYSAWPFQVLLPPPITNRSFN